MPRDRLNHSIVLKGTQFRNNDTGTVGVLAENTNVFNEDRKVEVPIKSGRTAGRSKGVYRTWKMSDMIDELDEKGMPCIRRKGR